MANLDGFKRQFAAVAGGVKTGIPSTSHWKGVEILVAELLQVDRAEVYISTISKPGNISVRFSQSKAAVAGKVLIGMYTGDPADLDSAIEAMQALARDRDGVAALAIRESADWTIVVVTARAESSRATALTAEFPEAVLIAF